MGEIVQNYDNQEVDELLSVDEYPTEEALASSFDTEENLK